MYLPRRETIAEGVTLLCLRTEKFKTGCFTLNLATPLAAAEAPKNALLPALLLRGTKSCPDMEKLSAALDELYGAELSSVCAKRDENQFCGFCGSVLSDGLAGNEPLLKSCAALAGEALLHPALKNGAFIPDYFKSEKRNLLDAIDGVINDKRLYAAQRLIQEMCAGEPYAVDRYGSREDADCVTRAGLMTHYRELVERAPVYIYCCSDKPFEEVRDIFLSALDGLPRGEIRPAAPVTTARSKGLKTVFESMDVAQGKLAMGFRVNRPLGWAVSGVFGTMFGGGMMSKLFRRVREELSLCYYVSAGVAAKKQLMLVSAGIEPSDFEKTRDEIFAQLDECRKGNITADELEFARAAMVSAIKSSADSHMRLEGFYSSQFLEETLCTIDERVEQLMAVTKDDLVEAANCAEADTIYFLRGLDE